MDHSQQPPTPTYFSNYNTLWRPDLHAGGGGFDQNRKSFKSIFTCSLPALLQSGSLGAGMKTLSLASAWTKRVAPATGYPSYPCTLRVPHCMDTCWQCAGRIQMEKHLPFIRTTRQPTPGRLSATSMAAPRYVLSGGCSYSLAMNSW